MQLHDNTAENTEGDIDATEGDHASGGQDAAPTEPNNRIIAQFYDAILDPNEFSLEEWIGIQESISEIEKLAPHIELIVRLRKMKGEKGQ
jgi:hypothetical protein